MKKSLMLAGAMMIGTFIFAQNDDGDNHHGGHHRNRGGERGDMKTVLLLEDTQIESIRAIDKKYGEQGRALRKDSTVAAEERSKAYKELRDKREKEVDNVLTKDQRKKWTTYKKERDEKRKRDFEKRGKERDAKLKSELSLTDDQLNKLKDARKSTHESMKQLHEKKTGDKEQFKKLREDHDAKVKSILTPEQYTKLKEMGSKKREGKHRKR